MSDAARAKPVIVQVIDSLVRGGAETLLVNLLPAIAERYDIVLVMLKPDCDFRHDELVVKELHCLGYAGTSSLVACASRLRRIIRRHRPALVHSQLFLASLVARIATPRSTPLVFSIHNPMSEDCYKHNRFSLPLEKLTYRKRHALIGVSKDALDDFDRWVGIKGKAYVLYNFIDDAYLTATKLRTAVGPALRLVAVGMLKEQKNYGYLIEAFKRMRGHAVSIDIYGEGPLRDRLQQEIISLQLPVRLMGKRPDVYNALGSYDLYVMPSRYEGFGIAPVEAMATGLPLLLSDLPVLHEVTFGNALFFDIADPDSLGALLGEVRDGRIGIEAMSKRGMVLARQNYGRAGYVERLAVIYAEVAPAINAGARGP